MGTGASITLLPQQDCTIFLAGRCNSPATMSMKHYCAKPSAQLPKHMHILHWCYKLADNHLTLFQLHIRAVKAMGIIMLHCS